MILKDNLKNELERINSSSNNQKVVFVSGKFNIIHPGHLRLFNFARSCGDFLVIGLLDDSFPEVVIDHNSRKEALSGLEAVDAVVTIDINDLDQCLNILKPYAVVKGAEYTKHRGTLCFYSKRRKGTPPLAAGRSCEYLV